MTLATRWVRTDIRENRAGDPMSFRFIAIQATDVDVRAAQLVVR